MLQATFTPGLGATAACRYAVVSGPARLTYGDCEPGTTFAEKLAWAKSRLSAGALWYGVRGPNGLTESVNTSKPMEVAAAMPDILQMRDYLAPLPDVPSPSPTPAPSSPPHSNKKWWIIGGAAAAAVAAVGAVAIVRRR